MSLKGCHFRKDKNKYHHGFPFTLHFKKGVPKKVYDKKSLDSILGAIENVLSLPHFEGHFFKRKGKQKNGAIYKSLHYLVWIAACQSKTASKLQLVAILIGSSLRHLVYMCYSSSFINSLKYNTWKRFVFEIFSCIVT